MMQPSLFERTITGTLSSRGSKTRSHDAEFGEIAKTILAASAQAEMALSALRRHQSAFPDGRGWG